MGSESPTRQQIADAKEWASHTLGSGALDLQKDDPHLDALFAYVTALEAESAELTKALTGLTANGSEFFVRRGDRYVADVKACVEYVRARQRDQHNYIIKAITARQAAEAENEKLRASLLEAVGALEPFAEACEGADDDAIDDHGHCWESGMAMAVTHGDFRRALAVHTRLSSSLEGGEGSTSLNPDQSVGGE